MKMHSKLNFEDLLKIDITNIQAVPLKSEKLISRFFASI